MQVLRQAAQLALSMSFARLSCRMVKISKENYFSFS